MDFVSANIPAEDIKLIKKKLDAVIAHMLFEEKKNKTSDLSCAYTEKLSSGSANGIQYKGKTPAELLISNPELRNALVAQTEWLTKNISDPSKSKYKDGNIKQYNAIADARLK